MICEYVCGIFVQKIAFYEIKLNRYSGIPILHWCAKFQQRIFLRRDMLEKPFFQRFWPVPGAKKVLRETDTITV